EGQKHSARVKGIVAPDPLTGRQVCDPSWRVNFAGLLSALAKGRTIQSAILVGSRPPKNDGVWESAKRHGFEVTVHDRSADNREKAVDTELVARGTELICSTPKPLDLVIASGDRDFVPLVNVAHRRGWSVEMGGFSSAFNVAGEMATSVEKVVPLDSMFGQV